MATNQTVSRLLIGNELRRLREKLGYRQDEAASHIGQGIAKVSRLEAGQTRVTPGDIKMLLELYGVDDREHVDALLDLARHNNQRGRWEGRRAYHPQWFRMYLDLEAAADEIRHVQAEIVPGVLQSESYMRALHNVAYDPRASSAESLEANVQERLERQQILDREDQVRLLFVLSESCLRRVIGGHAVMSEQLARLIELAERPNVQLQVLPYETPTYAGPTSFSFTYLAINAPGIASPLEVVYTELYDDARYADNYETVRPYADLWARLTAAALGPVESIDFMRKVAAEYQ